MFLGRSVAVSGDTLVAGSLANNGGGNNSGSVYVFTRSGTVWTQQAILTASDGASGDQFGDSVALSGDTVVIGAGNDDHAGGASAGSAYVFTRSGSVWAQQAKLIASDAAASDNFGISIALSADTTVVGAYRNDHVGAANAGSAYVFIRSGFVWTQQAKLISDDIAASDFFGHAVSVSGDTVVVGAYQDNHPAGADAGSAYLFTRSGTVWTQQAKLTASDAAASDRFGFAVAVSGGTAMIGAYLDDHAGGNTAGSTYVFELACASCPGDFDGDGTIGQGDLAQLLSCYGVPNNPCGDMDGDGSTTQADLAALLAVYGQPCL